MSFNEKGYEVVRNAISLELANFITTELHMLENVYRTSENIPSDAVFNDELCEGFYWYGAYATESLLTTLQPTIERVVGKQLFPTYSYFRRYKNNASMKKHTDRPECEYSITLTLSVDPKPWDIEMDGTPVSLDVGDACIYAGTHVEHERKIYHGNEQLQVFLHYVDVNGEYAHRKYDGRPQLGMMY